MFNMYIYLKNAMSIYVYVIYDSNPSHEEKVRISTH